MADIGASNWNETDGSNSTTAPDGAPEGMAPSGVNDTMRAMMGATKRFYDWQSAKTTGGTSTAFTLSYSVAPGALVDGMVHLVRFNATNGASATLNVNLLGAKPLYSYQNGAWAQVLAGTIITDMITPVAYNVSAGAYFLLDVNEVGTRGNAAAWGSINGTTVNYGFNVASVVHGSTGTYAITFTQALLSGNYVVMGTPIGSGVALIFSVVTTSTTGFTLTLTNSLSQTLQDGSFHFTVIGP